MRFINYVNKKSTIEYLVDDLDNPTKIMRNGYDRHTYYYNQRGERTPMQKLKDAYGENIVKNKFPVFEFEVIFSDVYKGENRSGFYVKDIDDGSGDVAQPRQRVATGCSAVKDTVDRASVR